MDDDGNSNALLLMLLEHLSISRIMEKALNLEADKSELYMYTQTHRHTDTHTHIYVSYASAAAKSLQLCPILCDPIDGSPPGSPIPGILQVRTLEWVAISFSNESER